MGTLLWETGKREQAYPLLEHAVTRCPIDPGLALQLGLADIERGALTAAQRRLTDAKHLDPSDRRIDLALQELALRKRDPRKHRRAA
jgi:predicted Zn-dependent protease